MVQKIRSRVTTIDEKYYACDICGGEITHEGAQAVCPMCDRDIHALSSEGCSEYDHELERVVCTTCWKLRTEYAKVESRCAHEVEAAYLKWRDSCRDHQYDNLPSDK